MHKALLATFMVATGVVLGGTSVGPGAAPSSPEPRAHVNLAMIGAPSRATFDLAKALFREATGRDPTPADFVGGVEVKYLEYKTLRFTYAQAVLPTAPRNLSQVFQALQSSDGVMLPLDASGGLESSSLEQCLWAKAAGVPKLVVFAWSPDGKSSKDRSGIRARLVECGFSGGQIEIIEGLGLRLPGGETQFSSVGTLLRALDEIVLPRERDLASPFVMPVDDVFQIAGRGTIVTGRVASGQVSVGATLSLFGNGRERPVKVTDIAMYKRTLDVAMHGDHVGIGIAGASRPDVARGMILAPSGALKQASTFQATVSSPTFLSFSSNGSLPSGEYVVLMHTMAFPARLKPAGNGLAEIQPADSVPVASGWRFLLLSQGKTAGMGSIKE